MVQKKAKTFYCANRIMFTGIFLYTSTFLVLLKTNVMPFVFIIFNFNLVLCVNVHSELLD